MRLAGLKECGLCCEIMADDGTMMRTPQLWEMAEKFGLVFITIKDLQDYCRLHEKHVSCRRARSSHKNTEISRYTDMNDITGEHPRGTCKGEIGDGEDVLCRVHSECLTGDVFGSARCDWWTAAGCCHEADSGRGPGNSSVHASGRPGIGLINKLKAYGAPGTGQGYRAGKY